MRRRDFIKVITASAVAWPLAARAQQRPKIPIIGFLHPGFPDSGSPVFDALDQGLRDAGYVEGETVKIEARWARGKPEVLPQLTRELIQLHADVLVATARPSIEAARAATTDLPTQFSATANQFKAGHRICLEITSMDVPTGTGAMTNVEYIPYHVCRSETVTHSIYHDAEHPSHLLIPVIPNRVRAA